MQRYFLTDQNEFDPNDIHHIVNVMRSKSGDQVELCLKGTCFTASLNMTGKIVSYEKLEELPLVLPKPITVVQGLPKGEKIELVAKYATLFGAEKIIFVPMKRSIAKLANTEHKKQRLEKISKEAAELAKLSKKPAIAFLNSFNELDINGKRLIVLDEQEKTVQLKDIVKNHTNEEIVVIIGPEGGIDQTEREFFKTLGALFVSLGASILPTELAHIPFLNAFSL